MEIGLFLSSKTKIVTNFPPLLAPHSSIFMSARPEIKIILSEKFPVAIKSLRKAGLICAYHMKFECHLFLLTFLLIKSESVLREGKGMIDIACALQKFHWSSMIWRSISHPPCLLSDTICVEQQLSSMSTNPLPPFHDWHGFHFQAKRKTGHPLDHPIPIEHIFHGRRKEIKPSYKPLLPLNIAMEEQTELGFLHQTTHEKWKLTLTLQQGQSSFLSVPQVHQLKMVQILHPERNSLKNAYSMALTLWVLNSTPKRRSSSENLLKRENWSDYSPLWVDSTEVLIFQEASAQGSLRGNLCEFVDAEKPQKNTREKSERERNKVRDLCVLGDLSEFQGQIKLGRNKEKYKSVSSVVLMNTST
ncbi:hypothetical protein VP01_670g2 [Puccinia sorghi]|uniref:Uncharacterized protein n=1 Tax=Puccinia sorghi TaxID=27349 RepID=A0A0L6UES9_9BASI|nr:hypothetical protein VP01_670g2 [Puccinia sorghi]